MAEKEEMERWIEVQRALGAILSTLGKLTVAQTHAIGGSLSAVLGDGAESKSDYSTALDAISEANELIKAAAERLQEIALGEIEKRTGHADGN